ncbi:heterokaryon incompatibility protein-domain-containing protein [Paraphoma chrysanthemicola]|uniref:Heterokaryon incompatibility protein-domain-containing protein n=1 Tax=Paraphoma chrysanthemicola TaxID=798071 RepID=A0A8K0QVL1_9PLEO|nr:heterokaryon incompatibility protein-domain-containing protein [Paraphoma chrysanthemicola]
MEQQVHMSIYESQLHDRNIRLLDLLPGKDSDPLQCNLIHTSLDGSIPYEALSYVWGDPSTTEPVMCCGKPCQITLNLAAALRSLRSTEASRMLWVDALCINQSNNGERSHQVQLMGDIFAKADSVTAWLGEDHSNAGELAKFTMNVVKIFCAAYTRNLPPTTSHKLRTIPLPIVSSLDVISKHCGLGNPVPALNAFFSRAYWRRIWCVQELIRARQIIIRIGTTELPSEMLAYFCSWYGSQVMATEDPGPINLGGVAKAGHMLKTNENSGIRSNDVLGLLHTLETYRNFQATDPRDKVYGLLGILRNPGVPLPITVDYNKSVVEVYTDVVWAAIEITNDLAILSSANGYCPRASDGGFPSWVPQWHKVYTVFRLYPHIRTNASSGRPLKLISREVCASQTIILAGITVDHVVHTSNEMSRERPLFGPDDSSKALLLRVAHQSERNEHQDGIGVSEGSQGYRPSVLAVATALTGGMILMDIENNILKFVNKPDTDENDIAQFLTNFWEYVGDQTSSEVRTQQSQFERLARMICHARRIFQTRKGFFGCGPAFMQEGDRIVVLDGATVPYVLRPLNEDRQEYAFMGECYIHDIMQGEIVQMLGQEGVHEMEFVLR